MKTKLLIAVCILILSSCNYLDIVPDERNQIEDAYNTSARVEGFLYSCYSFLLQRPYFTVSIDRCSGGEISLYEKGAVSIFPQGDYSPAAPGLSEKEWSAAWQGVRQCYIFLSILDKVNCINEDLIKQYRAEANLLIAYYHFQSMRAYGPTLIIDKDYDQNVEIESLPERSSVEEVTNFINNKINEAMPGLPEEQTGSYLGRMCRQMARALRSRMTLMVASPLFNPRPEDPTKDMYIDFKSPIDNRPLISTTFDLDKWIAARDAAWNAIVEAEKNGYTLYDAITVGAPSTAKPGFSSNNDNKFSKSQRVLRYITFDIDNNKEGLFYETRKEPNSGIYGLAGRSLPKHNVKQWGGDGVNSIAPTLQTVEKFYTKNGLPIDKDKTFEYTHRYELITVSTNILDQNDYPDRTIKTIKLHQNREPRFYAFIGFHGSNYEIANFDNAATSSTPSKMILKSGLQMLKNQTQGWNGVETVHYSATGYLNKRFFHPGTQRSIIQSPFPMFRLAEMYLNYAEALIEIGGDGNLQTAKKYINKIRTRAGILEIDDAWNNHSTEPGYQNTQEGMREIARRERQLEFYLEGHSVWDIRRWKLGEQEFNRPDLGWNIGATTETEFYNKPVNMTNRKSFHKGQYLMPIKNSEINKTPQIIQNPYY